MAEPISDEALTALTAETDQRVAQAKDDAKVIAAYHVTLIEGDVDEETASTLTENYQAWLLASDDPPCGCIETEDP